MDPEPAPEPATPVADAAPQRASVIPLLGACVALGVAIIIASGWAWTSRPVPAPTAPSTPKETRIPPRPGEMRARTLVAQDVAPTRDAVQPAEPPATKPIEQVATILDLNTASAAELELLPGVGPALAGRIIEHRTMVGPFRRVDDLDKVRGIGAKTLERIRPHVRVGATPATQRTP